MQNTWKIKLKKTKIRSAGNFLQKKFKKMNENTLFLYSSLLANFFVSLATMNPLLQNLRKNGPNWRTHLIEINLLTNEPGPEVEASHTPEARNLEKKEEDQMKTKAVSLKGDGHHLEEEEPDHQRETDFKDEIEALRLEEGASKVEEIHLEKILEIGHHLKDTVREVHHLDEIIHRLKIATVTEILQTDEETTEQDHHKTHQVLIESLDLILLPKINAAFLNHQNEKIHQGEEVIAEVRLEKIHREEAIDHQKDVDQEVHHLEEIIHQWKIATVIETLLIEEEIMPEEMDLRWIQVLIEWLDLILLPKTNAELQNRQKDEIHQNGEATQEARLDATKVLSVTLETKDKEAIQTEDMKIEVIKADLQLKVDIQERKVQEKDREKVLVTREIRGRAGLRISSTTLYHQKCHWKARWKKEEPQVHLKCVWIEIFHQNVNHQLDWVAKNWKQAEPVKIPKEIALTG